MAITNLNYYLAIAVRSGNVNKFNELIASLQANEKDARLAELFAYVDEEGNTIFHHLVTDLSTRKKRHAKTEICSKLVKLLKTTRSTTAVLNTPNSSGLSPLHIAIKHGLDTFVDTFLKAGVDITGLNNKGESYLEVAANYKRHEIYKSLLQHHTGLNKKNLFSGFTIQQIDQAEGTYKRNLKKKQLMMGILGTIMSIACPVGAILAFYQLPLLEIVFGALIPVVGPFIGLAGAAIIGGLLFWSMYTKTSMKYGAHAREKLEIEGIEAKLSSLEPKLKEIDKKLAVCETYAARQKLLDEKKQINAKLELIYSSVPNVEKRVEAYNSDWTTWKDVARARMLTFGSFLCAFSGILGIMGSLSSFFPTLLASSAIFAGVPIVGWAALGISLLVGVGVAVWAYKTKYKPSLEETGRARRNLHKKKSDLFERKLSFEKSANQFELTLEGSLSSEKSRPKRHFEEQLESWKQEKKTLTSRLDVTSQVIFLPPSKSKVDSEHSTVENNHATVTL